MLGKRGVLVVLVGVGGGGGQSLYREMWGIPNDQRAKRGREVTFFFFLEKCCVLIAILQTKIDQIVFISCFTTSNQIACLLCSTASSE